MTIQRLQPFINDGHDGHGWFASMRYDADGCYITHTDHLAAIAEKDELIEENAQNAYAALQREEECRKQLVAAVMLLMKHTQDESAEELGESALACPLTAAELRVMANWRKGVARDSSAALAKLNEARRPTGKAITDILALWLADAIEAKEKAEAERDALKQAANDWRELYESSRPQRAQVGFGSAVSGVVRSLGSESSPIRDRQHFAYTCKRRPWRNSLTIWSRSAARPPRPPAPVAGELAEAVPVEAIKHAAAIAYQEVADARVSGHDGE